MKFVLPLLALLLIGTAQAEQVFDVHDGDTFRLVHPQTQCLKGKPRKHESIRLYGIDAPEVDQPMGLQSRDALRSMVLGKDVQLQCPGCSFTRQACHVTVDGKDIEAEMVRQGWAFDSVKFSQGAFAKEQAEAQSHHRGVWKQKDGGVRPWDWRQANK